MQLSSSIFKAYDIRGVVPSTLTEEVAHALGMAFGTIARSEGEKSVAVGRDGLLSGPSLSAALVSGLIASGVDVIDIGMVTTPMHNFAANTQCASGIHVTASHNPKYYNRFKKVMAGDTGYSPGLGIHEMGTARMGRDPKTSVLNAYNQVHECKNVYVTDGAAMTSGACVNPSLTYMALTARACAHAVEAKKRGEL